MSFYRRESSAKACMASFHTNHGKETPTVQVIVNELNTALGVINFEPDKNYQIFFSLNNHKIKPDLIEIQDKNQETNKISNVQ